jgi:hypothetical protein
MEVEMNITVTKTYLKDLQRFGDLVSKLLGYSADVAEKASALLYGYLRCFGPKSLQRASSTVDDLDAVKLKGYLLLATGAFKKSPWSTVQEAIKACPIASDPSCESIKFCLSEFALHHMEFDSTLSDLLADTLCSSLTQPDLTDHDELCTHFTVLADEWFRKRFTNAFATEAILEGERDTSIQAILAACETYFCGSAESNVQHQISDDNAKLLLDMIEFKSRFAGNNACFSVHSLKQYVLNALKNSKECRYDYITMSKHDIGKLIVLKAISSLSSSSSSSSSLSSSSSSSSGAAAEAAAAATTVSTSVHSSLSASRMRTFLLDQDRSFRIVKFAPGRELHHIEDIRNADDDKGTSVPIRLIDLRKFDVRDPDGKKCILPPTSASTDACDTAEDILDKLKWLRWSSGVTLEPMTSSGAIIDKDTPNAKTEQKLRQLTEYARISFAVDITATVTLQSMSFRHLCIAMRKQFPKAVLFKLPGQDDDYSKPVATRVRRILRMFVERKVERDYFFLFQGVTVLNPITH